MHSTKNQIQKISWINIKEFIQDLQLSQHLSDCEGPVNKLAEANNKDFQSIINHHAPSC